MNNCSRGFGVVMGMLGLLLGAIIMHEADKAFLKAPSVSTDFPYTILRIDTVTDTVRIKEPEVVTATLVRRDTVLLPVTSPVMSAETDSASVEIPIVQKEYVDSVYHAWVSGYALSLDSIHVYPKTVIKTVRERNVRKWGFGVMAGVGVTPHDVSPFIGIGVSYNIFSW